MFTKIEPDGRWSCEGVDVTTVDKSLYGPLCKLRDYEKTGLNPGDFRAYSYRVQYMYKVVYEDKTGRLRIMLCETDNEAKEKKLARALHTTADALLEPINIEEGNKDE